ncbi:MULTISPECIES: hypothetical protein [Winogradskyella]|uniref:Uncharacterized protein n=1 Tax=Winogradskyella ouciana TaxID=2608631 RepID=A0A7K1GHA0_9FLAO|nr:hypothetical protein [Winogradskyella ouciana]MTE27279.1 hypothetical protein [Winogradskyella ouciana]
MIEDDKRIEDLVNKLMSADSLEQAPADFTDNVMSKIEAISESKTIVYKPLIPKYVWWLIASGFVGLVGYALFSKSNDTTSLSERYNLPDVSFSLWENFSFDFSNALMHATVLLAIMVGVQIPLLKQYFNNRLSY